jgi:hypothetical protein
MPTDLFLNNLNVTTIKASISNITLSSKSPASGTTIFLDKVAVNTIMSTINPNNYKLLDGKVTISGSVPTIVYNTGGLNSVTRSSAGVYVLTYTALKLTTEAYCQISAISTSAISSTISTQATITTVTLSFFNAAGGAIDPTGFYVSIRGY